MRIQIVGHHLPGRHPGTHRDVRVGLQVRKEPSDLVWADAHEVVWDMDVTVSHSADGRDFHGPVVQGRRGERFIYLTWLEGRDEVMFRRAKLMLPDAPEAEAVVARVDLTDECRLPRCARLRPPALEWSVAS